MKSRISFSFFPVLFVLLAAALTSCFMDDEVEPNPLTGGLEMYDYAYLQNSLAKDPARVAVKLNMLLRTALVQGVDPDDATYPAIEDSVTVQKNLQELFFGTNTLEETSPGVWKVTFVQGNENASDNPRAGVLTIDTGGDLMEDMGTTDAWTVTTTGYDIHTKNKSEKNKYTVRLGQPYLISKPAADNAWAVQSSGIECWMTNRVGAESSHGDWEIDLLMRTAADVMTYDKFPASIFRMSGTAQGRPLECDCEFEYTISSELEYKLSCSAPTLIMGTERIESQQLHDAKPKRYPDPVIKITWKRVTDCVSTVSINYDGNSYTVVGYNPEEE